MGHSEHYYGFFDFFAAKGFKGVVRHVFKF